MEYQFINRATLSFNDLLKKKQYKNLVQIIIGIILIVVLFKYVDVDKAKRVLSRANTTTLILIIIVFISDRILMAWKWLKLLNIKPNHIGIYHAVKAYYISNFVGFALPLGGLGPDVVRYGLLKKYELKSSDIISSIVIERILGLIGSLCLLLISFPILLNLLDISTLNLNVTLIIGLLITVVSISLFFIFNDVLRSRLLQFFRVRKLLEFVNLTKYFDAISKYGKHKKMLGYNIFLSFIEQFFPIFAFYLATMSFGLKIGFWVCLAIVPITTLLQRLPISYAGLGIREGGYIILLGLLNVDYSTALILSFTLFMLYTVSLLPGGIWYFMDMVSKNK